MPSSWAHMVVMIFLRKGKLELKGRAWATVLYKQQWGKMPKIQMSKIVAALIGAKGRRVNTKQVQPSKEKRYVDSLKNNITI